MAWGKADEYGTPRPPGTPPSPSASGGRSMSFVGNEVTISGNIKADGDMHVDGTIEGDLACGTLTLGGSGRVKGNIAADRATIAGTVEGTIAANDLTIEKSARVSGDLAYGNLSVEGGAKIDGKLQQRGGQPAGELKLVASKPAEPKVEPEAAAEANIA